MNILSAIIHWSSLNISYLDQNSIELDQEGHIKKKASEHGYWRISILGKRAYHETVQSFPITDLKEIKAAVAIDPAVYSPFDTNLFFVRKIARKQEHTLVNLWFVRPEAVQRYGLDRCFLLIPETALLSLHPEPRPRLSLISQKEDHLMVHVDKSGAVRSILTPSTTESVEAFQRSLGPEGYNCIEKKITTYRDYYKNLLSSLKDGAITELMPFIQWRIDRKKFFTAPLRRAVLGFTTMMIIYLMLWLGLPFMTVRQLAFENEKLTDSLGEALDRQAQIDALQEEIRILTLPTETTISKVSVLYMLHDTLALKAIINRLTIAANRVELHGMSQQATTVIDTLTKIPGLTQVQLMTPLRKDRKSGQDRFAISFLIEKEPFLNFIKTKKT